FAKKEIIFNSPFLKSLKIGETTGTFNFFSSIALKYSTLARFKKSSSSFNSSFKVAVSCFFQKEYRSFFRFTGSFVPISNRYGCIKSNGLNNPYIPERIRRESCKRSNFSEGIV